MTDVPSASHTSHWGAYTARSATTSSSASIRTRTTRLPSAAARQHRRPATGGRASAHPAIRRGWLEDGPGPTDRRGADEFVEVELGRGARPRGGRARAGQRRHTATRPSSAAPTAGRAPAASTTRRASCIASYGLLGGSTTSVGTYYSRGRGRPAARTSSAASDEVWRGARRGTSSRASTDLLVAFGGVPREERCPSSPAASPATLVGEHLADGARRGMQVVLLSPLATTSTPASNAALPLRPGDRHRADARALPRARRPRTCTTAGSSTAAASASTRSSRTLGDQDAGVGRGDLRHARPDAIRAPRAADGGGAGP